MKKTHLIILSLFLTSAIIITATVITYKALTVPKSKKYVVETIEANSKGYIKVGIISDAQLPQEEKNLYGWDYATVMNGADHLIKALKYYKSQNVDMIVFNGDMVNATGDYAAYSAYNKILDYVYGEDRAEAPHIIYPMGNHEFYGGNQEHNFYKSTGLPLNTRTIVNGYSFISISNSKLEKGDEELAESNDTLADGTYNEKRIEFLKEQLAAANTEDPNKPIFVFIHMPISNIVNGGHWATPQYEEIYSIYTILLILIMARVLFLYKGKLEFNANNLILIIILGVLACWSYIESPFHYFNGLFRLLYLLLLSVVVGNFIRLKI